MSSPLETSRMGLHPLIIVDVKSTRNIENGFKPLIIVDVKSTRSIENGFIPLDYCGCYKSTRNKNWIRPFDECQLWMSSLPATSIMGLHPLIIVDVKSTCNIDNGFTPFDYCGC